MEKVLDKSERKCVYGFQKTSHCIFIRHKMKKILIFSILYFVSGIFAFAKVNVESTVSPQAISPDSLLTLTVRVEHQDAVDIQSPELPSLDDFSVVNQSVSESYQFGTGGSQMQKEYQYSLKPKKEGTFQIGSIKVKVDGKVYETNPLEVEVSSQVKPTPQSPSARRRGGWGGLLDPFFGRASPFFQTVDKIKEEDLFLKLALDRKKPYVGEMITAQWFFYLRRKHSGNIFNSIMDEHPNLSGFWMESLLQPVSLVFLNAKPGRRSRGSLI